MHSIHHMALNVEMNVRSNQGVVGQHLCEEELLPGLRRT
jgi:hypothetical protein